MLPQLYMIGGPNGAGKTTIAFQLLPKLLSCYEYINDINCFCGWHRFFFGGEDFDVNEKNRRGLKKILREHIKKEHEKIQRDDGSRRPQTAGFGRVYLQLRVQ